MKLLLGNRSSLHAILLWSIQVIIVATPALAQRSYSSKDSSTVFLLLENAEQLAGQSNFPGALLMAKQALKVSHQYQMPRGEAYAQLKIADILYRQSDVKSLARYDSSALKIAIQLKDPFLTALSYYQLGIYFMSNGKGEQALQHFQKALATGFEKDQSSYTASVYSDIGFNYGNMGEVNRQIEWYLKALRVYEKVNDQRGLAQTLSNLSVVSNELKQRQDAIRYGRMALDIREKMDNKSDLSISYNNLCQLYMAVDSLEQASRYQELGFRYAKESGLKIRMAHSHITKALLLNRQKQNAAALEHEKQAIILLKEIGDSNMLSRRFIAAAIGFSSIKDSVRAVQYFDQAEKLSLQLNNKYNLRDVYYHQAGFYKNRKDFAKAYDMLKKYYAYRDSIIDEKTAKDIAGLQLQYETEKKDREIAALNADQKIRELEIEKQKAVIAGNLAEARQRQNEIDLLSQSSQLQDLKLQQQGEELEKQKLLARNREQELLLAEKEKMLKEEQLQGQKQFRNLLMISVLILVVLSMILFSRYQLKKKLEQQQVLLNMRNNISRNLHDDIGASLSNINILNELTKRNVNDPAKASSYLVKAGDDIQRISESLSDIVWNINPQYDDLDKLFIRMKRYAADMLDGRDIIADLVFPVNAEQLHMPMDQRRDLYLIFKEAVNNLVKYSKATSALVVVTHKDHHVYLRVKDNGKGFETGESLPGNGIQNMNQRAEKWNAALKVRSSPGQGTDIELDMKISF